MNDHGYHTEQGPPVYQQDRGICFGVGLNSPSGAVDYRAMLIFDGNQAAGGIAAALACQLAAMRLVGKLLEMPHLPALKHVASQCLIEANSALWAVQKDLVMDERSGSTGTIALVNGDTLTVAYVGDSPVMLLQGRRLYRLLRGHTLAEELVQKGAATREQVRNQVSVQSILTRCLGMEETVRPSTVTFRIKRPALIIGGTDGALRALSLRQIGQILRDTLSRGDSTAQGIAEAIAREAIAQGSDDNATVAVIRLRAREPYKAAKATMPSVPGNCKQSPLFGPLAWPASIAGALFQPRVKLLPKPESEQPETGGGNGPLLETDRAVDDEQELSQ